MADTQASYFMLRGYPTHVELIAAGGVFQDGRWVFPDGSTGRPRPMEGRFIPDPPELDIPAHNYD